MTKFTKIGLAILAAVGLAVCGAFAFAESWHGYRLHAFQEDPEGNRLHVEVYPAPEAPNPPHNISIFDLDSDAEFTVGLYTGKKVILEDYSDPENPGDGDIDVVYGVSE